MKKLFTVAIGIMTAISLFAWWIEPSPDGKLVWVSDDNPRRTEQIALFNQEERAGLLNTPRIPRHPPAGLKLDPNNGGMEKVIVQSLAGVGPDLFDCYDGKQLAAYVRSGIAMDITASLKARGLSTSTIWPFLKPVISYNGKTYGWGTNAAVNALWVNKDIFAQAGEALPSTKPWTWQQFLPLAQRLTKSDSSGRVVQYGFLADWAFLWQTCMLQWGGHLYSPDGTRCVLDSGQCIAGVQFAHDLIYKYHVMPSPVEEISLSGEGGWGQGTINWFEANKGAMALGGRWWLCNMRDETHSLPGSGHPKLNVTVVECPHGPLRLFQGYGKATLVNAGSPRAQEALDFMVFMSQKPYNDLINSQADGVGPVEAFCNSPEFLHNPAYPEEDYNAVWREVMDAGVPEEVSPFADGEEVTLILQRQLDLVKSDQKPVRDALQTAASQINTEIQKMIDVDPSLRRQYNTLVAAQRRATSR